MEQPDSTVGYGPCQHPAGRSSASPVEVHYRHIVENAVLARLGPELGAANTAEEVAHVVLDAASALFRWDACRLHVMARGHDQFQPLLNVNTLNGHRIHLPGESGVPRQAAVIEAVMRSGAQLINGRTGEETIATSTAGDPAGEALSIMHVPLRRGRTVLGVLSLESRAPEAFTADDLRALQALADHCAGAVDRIRVQEALHRLEREVLDITQGEQTRIGSELHDGLCQILGAMALQTRLLTELLNARELPEAEEAEALRRLVGQALQEARRLAQGLAPVELDHLGLPAALRRFCEETEARTRVACRFDSEFGDLLLPPAVKLHLFRIVQESVCNALSHGHPRQILVNLTRNGSQLDLIIRDDGRGFVLDVRPGPGMGLKIIHYRAGAIGGQVAIRSQPGQGSEVACRIPDISCWDVGGSGLPSR